jgi:hypothetical protein
MHIHPGADVEHLTNTQRLMLAAVIAAILLGLAGMLFAAIHTHRAAPAVPGPAPASVQPAPVSATSAPPISV